MSDKESELRDELMMARSQVKKIAMEREKLLSEMHYALIEAQGRNERLQKDLDCARRDAIAVLAAYAGRLPVNGEILGRVKGYDRLVDGWKAIQNMADQAASAERKDPA